MGSCSTVHRADKCKAAIWVQCLTVNLSALFRTDSSSLMSQGPRVRETIWSRDMMPVFVRSSRGVANTKVSPFHQLLPTPAHSVGHCCCRTRQTEAYIDT